MLPRKSPRRRAAKRSGRRRIRTGTGRWGNNYSAFSVGLCSFLLRNDTVASNQWARFMGWFLQGGKHQEELTIMTWWVSSCGSKQLYLSSAEEQRREEKEEETQTWREGGRSSRGSGRWTCGPIRRSQWGRRTSHLHQRWRMYGARVSGNRVYIWDLIWQSVWKKMKLCYLKFSSSVILQNIFRIHFLRSLTCKPTIIFTDSALHWVLPFLPVSQL